MSIYSVSRTIHAPVHTVFEVVSDVRNFSKAVPHIVKVEFLSNVHSGVGTRFRETRNMKGRETSTVLEVTEYEPDRLVRIVSDAGGTIWDSVFRVEERNGQTELSMTMEAKPKNIGARLLNFMIGGMLRKALASDLDAVKAYCEGAARP